MHNNSSTPVINEGNNDSEGQISKMILFIEKEAAEKIAEIKAKVDNEAVKEQGRIIMEETKAINEIQRHLLKQVEVACKVEHTNKINQYRLTLYKGREKLLEELFSVVTKKICDIRNNTEKYTKLVEELLLQAMYGMMCDSLIVKCREDDLETTRSACRSAMKKYEKSVNSKTVLTVDTKDFLPNTCYGGVILIGLNNTISVDNTLNEKLSELYERIPPNLEKELFGD